MRLLWHPWRVSVRRWVAFIVSVSLVAAAGCSSDAPQSTPSVTERAEALSLIPDGPPVLTVGSFDWNHPAIRLPTDFHTTVLYGDGTLIRFFLQTRTRMAYATTSIPTEQVEAILRLADAAGLGDGVALPNEPSPVEVVDGGWTVITRRSANGTGRVIVDQLGSDNDQSSDRRTTLAELVSALPLGDVDTWPTMQIERWAVESAGPLPDLATDSWPWPDLDPGTLDWKFNDAGVRCAIVTRPDWEFTSDEAATLAGVFRRPLLPSERSCDDVFSWRATLAVHEDVSTPDGLSPPSV